ncbi:uncharacterized protein I303_108261 [Kwoniella dejecticola CBS 10117]|uniref:Transmembrane protein n=1 Tax=Kwoniella dejecticola CBS 10117 TaxID=1296121 RepID=A0A1A5ZXV9_9TREE|nr:uncharacterized protein I303_07412 [Kwoniella dejecticola CBS 10117]OBR82649.1 hypothetical protein I303_07412 [Kwoniella dejecticola CBS 10117]
MYIIPTLHPRATITATSGGLTFTFTEPVSTSSGSSSSRGTATATGAAISSRTASYYSATSRASSSRYSYYSYPTYTSSSSRSSSSGLSSPLKIFIPIFATFFAIVVLVFIITAVRRADMHRRFHSKTPPRMGATNIPQIPINRSNSPFDIDSPRVTPYPAPMSQAYTANTSGPVIQDIPSAYQSIPTARDQTHNLPGYQYQASEAGMTMPPTYDEVLRGNNR